MVPFTALMLWTIALSSMATDIYSPFDALEMNLSEYQNPWPVINNTLPVYLSRVSMENSTLPCVKSLYWGFQDYNRTVDRSLNFSANVESYLNITLNVGYETSQNGSNLTMVQVASIEKTGLPSAITPIVPYVTANRTFLVLYSDPKCLILGDVLNATGFTNCSLWFTHKGGLLYPPLCCEFVFTILCGQSTKFDWIKSCKFDQKNIDS
uniref:Lipocalin n=1 Tax=Rhipicephalus zambeziensis TaxID=60191 RepID=A0A224YBV9_9ACAR